jgi:uncharacterized membrane protein
MTRCPPSVLLALLAGLALGPTAGCGAGTDRPPPGYGEGDGAAIGSCGDPSFATAVLPVLQARCGQCHRPNAPLGGLSLHEYGAVLEGGQSGPVVVPGSCVESLIYQLTAGNAQPSMPPNGYEGLTADELGCLCDWIEGGALDD